MGCINCNCDMPKHKTAPHDGRGKQWGWTEGDHVCHQCLNGSIPGTGTLVERNRKLKRAYAEGRVNRCLFCYAYAPYESSLDDNWTCPRCHDLLANSSPKQLGVAYVKAKRLGFEFRANVIKDRILGRGKDGREKRQHEYGEQLKPSTRSDKRYYIRSRYLVRNHYRGRSLKHSGCQAICP